MPLRLLLVARPPAIRPEGFRSGRWGAAGAVALGVHHHLDHREDQSNNAANDQNCANGRDVDPVYVVSYCVATNRADCDNKE